jgi:hypothetical protein
MFGAKKDAAFFDAFTEHAARSVEAAKLLIEMFKRLGWPDPSGAAASPYKAGPQGADAPVGIDDELQRLADRIKAVEHKGDTITHETVKRLRENWITPLDRNDIHELISRMDDVLDLIEAVAERVVLFRVRLAAPEAGELASLLLSACEVLCRAIALLRTMARAPEILELCVEVNRLENAADTVYRRALADLFQPGNDPLTVMKWRDIFDSLESAADRCEDVANIIEGVVLEYA